MLKISDTRDGRFDVETDMDLTVVETTGHSSFFISEGNATLAFTLYYESDYIVAYYHLTSCAQQEPIVVPGDIVLKLKDGYLREMGYRLEKLIGENK